VLKERLTTFLDGHKRVYDNPKATARLERMLAGLGDPSFEAIDGSDVDRVVEASGAAEDLSVRSGRVRCGIDKIGLRPNRNAFWLTCCPSGGTER